MNRYERKLEELIKNYHFDIELPGDSMVIHNILMDLFKTRCEGKKVALWGAGRKNTENSHAAVILKKYTTYIQGMAYLIDSMEELWGDEFLGYPIIAPSQIKEAGINMVIISSKVQADSIKKDLEMYCPGCEYIDIYDELRKRGIKVYHKFYEESNIYTTIFRLRKEYEANMDNALTASEKLRTIIGAYLSIRDMHYAIRYCREYIEKAYENSEDVRRFLTELETLIKEVKKANEAKKEDVVIWFIDSLRAMDVFHKREDGTFEADMFEDYLSKAVTFTNAKSTGVTTYESMISIIKKKYPYEQNVYENNIMFDFDDFSLLPVAKEQNYDIHFYISEGYQIIHDNPDITYTKQIYMAEKLWTLVTDMADNNNKTFNFVYFPYELHFPLICGYHEKEPEISGFVDVGVEDTSSFVPRQLEECKAYVNLQMKFYKEFFSDDMLLSVFADHSQVVYDDAEKKPYFMYYNQQERCVNVTFFIKGWGLEPQWNQQLVSMYDFNDIMLGLMRNRKLVVPDRKYAQYQYYRIHYKKLREYAISHGMEDYINGMNCCTSLEYLYMISETGKEEVYKLDDNKKNIITTEEGKRFAAEVKSKVNLSFPQFLE